MQVEFNIYGVRVLVRGSDLARPAIDDLRSEFGFFEQAEASESSVSPPIEIDIEIELHSLGAKHLPTRWPVTTHLGRVCTSQGARWVSFHDGSWVSFRQRGPTRKVDFGLAPSPESLGNLANFVHSSVGEHLEEKGFVRFHALGFAGEGAVIEWAPRGFGKSTKARKLLLTTALPIYGDETILVKDDVVYPYPARIATVDDVTTSIEQSQRQSAEITRRFLGSTKKMLAIKTERVAPPLKLARLCVYTRAPRGFRRLGFLASLTLGLGLPQMKEYMIRASNLLRLTRLFRQRLRLALRLAFSDRIVFCTGPHLVDINKIV